MEVDVEDACRRRAKQVGGHLLKFLPWLATGFPDRILLLPGAWIVFMEFKAPKKGLRPRQAFWQRTLVAMGFRHAIIRTVAEFDLELEYWRKRNVI